MSAGTDDVELLSQLVLVVSICVLRISIIYDVCVNMINIVFLDSMLYRSIFLCEQMSDVFRTHGKISGQCGSMFRDSNSYFNISLYFVTAEMSYSHTNINSKQPPIYGGLLSTETDPWHPLNRSQRTINSKWCENLSVFVCSWNTSHPIHSCFYFKLSTRDPIPCQFSYIFI